MRRHLMMILMLVCAGTAMAQGISFEKGNLDTVLEKARKEKKMVFIDAFATWCGPCKWMAKNVFTDAEVGKYFDENVVATAIDVERGEGPAVKSKYAIDGMPGYLFMDSEGNVIYRGMGSMPKDKFMTMVKKAKAIMDDPDNVGRYAAQYEQKKNDPAFLKTYLDKLKEGGSAGYYDVVENYLKVQNTMKADGAEMVNFLYKHIRSLTFGGEADRILSENLWTYAWDAYVRKDIREEFQKLGKYLAAQTTEYAIERRDTTMLDMAIERVKAYGEQPAEGQRERLLMYYYSHTGEGEKYKALNRKEMEKYYNEKLNVTELREGLKRVQAEMQKNPGKKMRPWAQVNTEKFREMLSEYARFMTERDHADILRWATRLHEVYPEAAENEIFYARALYMCGGDKGQAVAIFEKNMEDPSLEKKLEGLKMDLEAMKAGKTIPLLY
ncbi:MAG: thioredoxin family protein [Prevotella sp.]